MRLRKVIGKFWSHAGICEPAPAFPLDGRAFERYEKDIQRRWVPRSMEVNHVSRQTAISDLIDAAPVGRFGGSGEGFLASPGLPRHYRGRICAEGGQTCRG